MAELNIQHFTWSTGTECKDVVTKQQNTDFAGDSEGILNRLSSCLLSPAPNQSHLCGGEPAGGLADREDKFKPNVPGVKAEPRQAGALLFSQSLTLKPGWQQSKAGAEQAVRHT